MAIVTRPFDLIVFDWDGTLMDSTHKICDCIGRAAVDCGVPDPGPARSRQIIGLGLAEALATLFPSVDGARLKAIADRYRHYYLDPQTTPTQLFEGVQDGLQLLRDVGYKLAIATGKSRRGLEQVLMQTPIASYFVASRCADECRSKPDPLMLEELLLETGIGRERALMVGDTTFDLQMARNAQVAALGVTYGAHAADQLKELASFGYASSFGDILRWLT